MLTTSLVTAAVAALVTPGASVGSPTWQPDYRTALARSAEQRKPVAVFIALGTDGYSQLVTDGGLGAEAARMLRQNYICFYVDTATNSGRELSQAFGIAKGLVISDKTGGAQALRHEGTVSRADLTGYLIRFADAAPASQTEFHGAAQPVAVAPAAAPPVYQPVYQPQMTFSPAMSFRSFTGGG